jgi:2-polyprenyl-6-methoxyphenol hydroxylase-like FAD-dependent oxidoreductase
LLFAVDEAGFWGAGAGSICALRGDVLELLRSCISDSVVRWATTVSAISQHGIPHGPEVEVSFRDADPESYDFVVAADGVHSGVRSSIFGHGGRPCCLMPVGGS